MEKKKILFAAVLGLFLAVFSLKGLWESSADKLKTVNDKLQIGHIPSDSPLQGLDSAIYSPPPARFFIREFLAEPLFIKNAEASEKPADVSIRGSVSGNLIKGELEVRQTFVESESLGNFQFQGALQGWGKKEIQAAVNFQDADIRAVNNLLSLNIPFSGRASGRAVIDYKGENQGTIEFDLKIRELTAEEDGSNYYNAAVQGKHDFAAAVTIINKGELTGQDENRITFSGSVGKDEFIINFETEEMILDDLLRLVPKEIRERYNLDITGGKMNLKEFSIQKVKKKST